MLLTLIVSVFDLETMKGIFLFRFWCFFRSFLFSNSFSLSQIVFQSFWKLPLLYWLFIIFAYQSINFIHKKPRDRIYSEGRRNVDWWEFKETRRLDHQIWCRIPKIHSNTTESHFEEKFESLNFKNLESILQVDTFIFFLIITIFDMKAMRNFYLIVSDIFSRYI